MTEFFSEWNKQLDCEILIHTELLELAKSLTPVLANLDFTTLTNQLQRQRTLVDKLGVVRQRRRQLVRHSEQQFHVSTVTQLIPYAPASMQQDLAQKRDTLRRLLQQLQRHQELALQLMRSDLGMLNEVLSAIAGVGGQRGTYGRGGLSQTATVQRGSLLDCKV